MRHTLSHDLLQTSPLFEGEVPKKPANYMLIAEIEKYLSTDPTIKQQIVVLRKYGFCINWFRNASSCSNG